MYPRFNLTALAIIMFIMILHSEILPAEEAFSINGYYKNFFNIMKLPEYMQDQPAIGSVNNRLRLNASCKPAQWISFELSYSNDFQIKDPIFFSDGSGFAFLNSHDYRASDLNPRLYPSKNDPIESFGIFQNLDRALITFSPSFADIYIGRQAISWGSARMVNPTDIISPFSFDQLDTEERRGVDALRMRIPTGMMGEADLGIVFGKDFEFKESLLFLRGRFYKFDTDISILMSDFLGNFLAGIDIARNIGGAGFWTEAAYVFANTFQDDKDQGDNYAKAAVGMDYNLTSKLYGFLEYHWNQAGAGDPEEYLSNLNTIAYNEGATYLMGKHYIIPGATYQIAPLITFDSQLLANLFDPSAFFSSRVEYNIKQDIYISIGALLGFGSKSKININELAFSSEFGQYPDVYYSSFRIYF